MRLDRRLEIGYRLPLSTTTQILRYVASDIIAFGYAFNRSVSCCASWGFERIGAELPVGDGVGFQLGGGGGCPSRLAAVTDCIDSCWPVAEVPNATAWTERGAGIIAQRGLW